MTTDATAKKIRQAMKLRERGFTNREISERLSVSRATASYYARGMTSASSTPQGVSPRKEWTRPRVARALRALADAVESGDHEANQGSLAALGYSVQRKIGPID